MLDKLQKIARKYTDSEDFTLTENMTLLTDLGLNSYELVQMVCDVEDVFEIEIPDRAISGFKTVQNVMDYIASQKERTLI